MEMEIKYESGFMWKIMLMPLKLLKVEKEILYTT